MLILCQYTRVVIYLSDDDDTGLVRVHLWQEAQSSCHFTNVFSLEIVLGGEAECLLGIRTSRTSVILRLVHNSCCISLTVKNCQFKLKPWQHGPGARLTHTHACSLASFHFMLSSSSSMSICDNGIRGTRRFRRFINPS